MQSVRSPLGGEVYKLGGETVSGQLWRRLVHHLFELLERGAPRVVGEFQNGQLDLQRGLGKRRKEEKEKMSVPETQRKSAAEHIFSCEDSMEYP